MGFEAGDQLLVALLSDFLAVLVIECQGLNDFIAGAGADLDQRARWLVAAPFHRVEIFAVVQIDQRRAEADFLGEAPPEDLDLVGVSAGAAAGYSVDGAVFAEALQAETIGVPEFPEDAHVAGG